MFPFFSKFFTFFDGFGSRIKIGKNRKRKEKKGMVLEADVQK
jgi:hypothetical protein